MRKLLSLLLITAMLLTVPTVCMVQADELAPETSAIEVKESSEHIENARNLLSAAGIEVSFSDDASAPVSRGDFLMSVIDAFKFETIGSETCFYDVKASDKFSGAVNMALELGIISEGTYFRPNDTITYFEACKMIVSVLGYDNKAAIYGGWPYGYVYMADKLSVTDNLKIGENLPLYSAQALIMMRNMAEAEIGLVNSIIVDNSEYVVKYDGTDNLLGQLYGWYKIEGIVYGDDLTHMYDGNTVQKDGCILVEDDVYYCEEEVLIGTYVYGYAVLEEGKDVIKYIETNSGVLTLYPTNMPQLENGVIKYFESDDDKEAVLGGNYATIYNGKACLDAVASDYDIDVGKLVLIDSDRDRKYDVVYIYSGDIAYADVVNTGYRIVIDNFVRSGERNAKKFDLLSNDVEYKIYSGNTEAGVSRITAGTAFEYYESKDGKNVEIHVLEKQVIGRVTATSESEIYIDDVKYETTNYFNERFKNNLTHNKELTFVLTEANSVAVVLSNVNAAYNLALVTGVSAGNGVDTSVILRLFTENGNDLTLSAAKKVRINDERTVNDTDLVSYFTDDSGTLVRYATDKDEKISKLWLEETAASNQENSYYHPGIDNVNVLRPFVMNGEETDEVYYKIFGVFIPHFTVGANTKVFLVNTADNIAYEDKFSIGSMDSWSNDSLHLLSTLHPYNVSTSGLASIMVLKSNTMDDAIDNEKSSGGVICGITKAMNRRDEDALKITVGTANSYSTIYLPKSHADYNKAANISAPEALRVGDYIMYTTDIYDNIMSYRKDFDSKTKNIDDSYSSTDNDALTYYYGELMKVEDDSYALDIIDSSSGVEGNVSIKAHEMYDTRQNVWVVDANGAECMVTSEALSALNKFMEQGFTMLVRLRYGGVIETCLYASER